ncbi:uncharacterized protein G2W53_024229 [Senna tora]|uniref:Uncharacterized protein n=1 Tax=Senna tora TaxID=362788 RepID=A0A834TJR3_9FABA|nr:uncharacterized protein G2W53_024229 [Senna tora]
MEAYMVGDMRIGYVCVVGSYSNE